MTLEIDLLALEKPPFNWDAMIQEIEENPNRESVTRDMVRGQEIYNKQTKKNVHTQNKDPKAPCFVSSIEQFETLLKQQNVEKHISDFYLGTMYHGGLRLGSSINFINYFSDKAGIFPKGKTKTNEHSRIEVINDKTCHVRNAIIWHGYQDTQTKKEISSNNCLTLKYTIESKYDPEENKVKNRFSEVKTTINDRALEKQIAPLFNIELPKTPSSSEKLKTFIKKRHLPSLFSQKKPSVTLNILNLAEAMKNQFIPHLNESLETDVQGLTYDKEQTMIDLGRLIELYDKKHKRYKSLKKVSTTKEPNCFYVKDIEAFSTTLTAQGIHADIAEKYSAILNQALVGVFYTEIIKFTSKHSNANPLSQNKPHLKVKAIDANIAEINVFVSHNMLQRETEDPISSPNCISLQFNIRTSRDPETTKITHTLTDFTLNLNAPEFINGALPVFLTHEPALATINRFIKDNSSRYHCSAWLNYFKGFFSLYSQQAEVKRAEGYLSLLQNNELSDTAKLVVLHALLTSKTGDLKKMVVREFGINLSDLKPALKQRLRKDLSEEEIAQVNGKDHILYKLVHGLNNPENPHVDPDAIEALKKLTPKSMTPGQPQ